MMERHPIFGVGMGQFKPMAVTYNPEILHFSHRSWLAHDTFVQIGAECGLPVLLLFVMMIALALRNFKKADQGSDPSLIALGRAMQLGLIGISAAATSISVEFLPFGLLIFLSPNFAEVARGTVQPQSSEPFVVEQVGIANRTSLSVAPRAALSQY
jgi:O-antigen ligase